MFTCARCNRGFDIARAARIPESVEEIAERATPQVREVFDLEGNDCSVTLTATRQAWVAKVTPLLADLIEGQDYAFFDGHAFPYRHGPIRFRGLFREHDLPDLPHIAGAPLGDIVTHHGYWKGQDLDSVLREIEAEHQSVSC